MWNFGNDNFLSHWIRNMSNGQKHFCFLLNLELYSLIGLFLIVKQIKTIIAIQIYRVINNN